MSDCLMFVLQNFDLQRSNGGAFWLLSQIFWFDYFDRKSWHKYQNYIKMYKIMGFNFILLSFAITYCFIVTSLNIKQHLNLINRRGVKVEILGVNIKLC